MGVPLIGVPMSLLPSSPFPRRLARGCLLVMLFRNSRILSTSWMPSAGLGFWLACQSVVSQILEQMTGAGESRLAKHAYLGLDVQIQVTTEGGRCKGLVAKLAFSVLGGLCSALADAICSSVCRRRRRRCCGRRVRRHCFSHFVSRTSWAADSKGRAEVRCFYAREVNVECEANTTRTSRSCSS